MKLLRKLLKWIFLLILIYCIGLIVYTVTTEASYYRTYGKSNATQDSEVIGTISLYTSPIDKFSTTRLNGHSWIYIENTSNAPFTLNGIVVEVNQGITFGTSGHPDLKPSGIWFNIESFNSSYLENVSIEGTFYAEDLEQLEIYLSKHSKWNILYNCATFTSGVWNSTYEGAQTPIFAISPKGLRFDIKKLDNHKVNEPFKLNKNVLPYTPNKALFGM